MRDNERVLLPVSKEVWYEFLEFVSVNCFSTELPPAVRGLLAELVLLAASHKDKAMRAGA
jgi:hypothetical protein